jgi:hypothetical protein
MADKFEVLTDTFCDGWVNCWSDDDEDPCLFDTLEEAEAELRDMFNTIASDGREPEDDYSPDEYMIRNVRTGQTFGFQWERAIA